MTEFNTPLYSLKMVTNATGLKPATLRAWERRYGLPVPGRTSGRHRLYSEHDIETLRWLTARMAEGASIRQAVGLWFAAAADGSDPLAGQTREKNSLSPTAGNEVVTIESLRDEWLEACKDFDETTAEKVLDRAFDLFPLEPACVQILQSGLRKIGEDWFAGRASIQQEHFTSGQAIRRLESLFASSPLATRPQTVLVGCPAGEWHTFAPLLLVLILRQRGLHVVYLGADLPGDQMIETVRQVNPNLVILVAQTLVSAASLLPAMRRLLAENHTTAFGGWIFSQLPDLSKNIPGHYLGNDLEAAALAADHLAVGSSPYHPISAPGCEDNPWAPVLDLFKQKRALIEITVLQNPEMAALELQRMWAANLSIGNDLRAALELGDIEFLALDLRWINELLGSAPAAQALLRNYLGSYRRALQEHLGAVGKDLIEWEGWNYFSA
ncbi:MAG: MerR family transcriptional regulator [Anaerolineaceae bacterium]